MRDDWLPSPKDPPKPWQTVPAPSSDDAAWVADQVKRTAKARDWPPAIRDAYLAGLYTADDWPEIQKVADSWANPPVGYPQPGAAELAAMVRSRWDSERAKDSGAYKGPAQIILPGVGDVKTDAGARRAKVALGVGGALVVLGLGLWSGVIPAIVRRL